MKTSLLFIVVIVSLFLVGYQTQRSSIADIVTPGDALPIIPQFSKPPKIEKTSTGFTITFTVQNACDVTVWVATPDGAIIRRLACGCLGPNAPEPFQRGTLTQRIEWDGKDDNGQVVQNGFVVHVGLGMRVKFSRILFAVKPGIATRGPAALTCDSQGVLHILWGHMRSANLGGIINLTRFDREGNYLQTIYPFRTDLPKEKISAVNFLQTPEGCTIPLTGRSRHRPYSGFLPGIDSLTRHNPLITRDGRYIFPSGIPVADAEGRIARRLLCINTDGSCQKDTYFGPPLPPESAEGLTFLAFSPDEKYVYISGTYHLGKGKRHHAVYRVQWTDTEPPKPFVGTECESGNDNAHFNDPRGIAVDSHGRLYVCDYKNDRIQVYTSDGKYIKTLTLPGPDQVLVHPKTHAIYILSIRDRGNIASYASKQWEVYENKAIVKLKSLDEPVEVGQIELPKRQRYFHDCPPILVLDTTANPAVIWTASVGRQAPGDYLWKIIDDGNTLRRADHKIIGYPFWSSGVCPAIAAAREYNEFYLVGGGIDGAVRIKAGSGEIQEFPIPKEAINWLGRVRAGPHGWLYLNCGKLITPPKDMRWIIRRYDRDGKLIPFKEKEGLETLGYHSGTYKGEMCPQFAIAPDGKIYVSECSTTGGVARSKTNVYSPDGELIKSGFISDQTHTPAPIAVDGMGRFYTADAVKPVGVDFPPFLGSDPRGHFKYWYGTVCRFGSNGGAFRHVGENEKYTHIGGHRGGIGKVVIEGAEWEYFGISPMPQSSLCECHVAGLDADAFGRIFVTDVCTHSIRVLDSAGNLILRFGEYGNLDSRGADSSVPMPEIPLRYPSAVAALDEYAAVADAHNRRIIEVKFSFQTHVSVNEQGVLQYKNIQK